jgi:thiol:disulfide interchange protein/DsbC/DsbD-like thiol-disulfide interchange protein
MIHALVRRLAVMLPLLGLGQAAWAAESAPVQSPRMIATLVSDTDAVAQGVPFRLGLWLRIAPGWHSYWRNPGDAGAAPELEFTFPAGMTASPPSWPAPVRKAEGPLMTYGYEGEVLLPVTVSGTQPGPVLLHATWLVCDNICVPEEGVFSLDLPLGTPRPSVQAALFAATDALVPAASPFQATVSAAGVLAVRGAGLNADSVRDAWFLPLAWGQVEHSAPQKLLVGTDGFTLGLKPGPQFDAARGLAGVLVIRDRSGQEARLTVDAVAGAPPVVADATPLLQVLGLAFLGGLILNLMPCVFPVLAIKAIGLARLSGTARGAAVAQSVSYAVGVVLTFMLVAGALLGARGAGASVGWGFQFQSPAFVAGMAWLLFAVGLNLSGVFAVGGPVGVGQGLASRGGHVGSFFTGALAVLVATPCTAPFMGAAIAAALAAPPVVTLAVFAAMGLGLAAPYVLLAAIPGFARLMPRPGAWTEVLKQAMAFPMYGASVWLLWVVSQQAGPEGVLATAGGLALVGFAGWAVGVAQSGLFRRTAGVAAVVACVVAAIVLAGVSVAATPEARAESGTEAYSAARLADLRAQGRPVFVNMTASWCVTCLVNDRVALSSPAVRQAFADRGVTYLKGDWTRQDKAITAFLRGHDRDGVPLYVMYPAGNGAPALLPQILTEGMVLDALARAGG